MNRQTFLKIVHALTKLMPVFSYENWAAYQLFVIYRDVNRSHHYSTGPPLCLAINR